VDPHQSNKRWQGDVVWSGGAWHGGEMALGSGSGLVSRGRRLRNLGRAGPIGRWAERSRVRLGCHGEEKKRKEKEKLETGPKPLRTGLNKRKLGQNDLGCVEMNENRFLN
jgi:hypothetical protein